MRNFAEEYKQLDIEAGKYNRPEFDEVYKIIGELVKEIEDIGHKGNLAYPLVEGEVIDRALELSGYSKDSIPNLKKCKKR